MRTICTLNERALNNFLLLLIFFVSQSSISYAQNHAKNVHEKKTKTATCEISITKNGQNIATLTAEILNSTLAHELKLDEVEKSQSGPRLSDLLKSLNIEDFHEIKILGYAKGRLATAEYSLKKEQIHDKIILSFSKRGTVKLVVPELAFDDWVIDVYQMEVK